MAPARLVARDARDDPAQPRARRPRLSAGLARRAAARLPVPARPTCRRPSCAWRAACRRRGSRPPRRQASPSRPCPTSAGARCDIKTVMLLPASLAKEAARGDGAKEAWFVDDDGYVTEGASSNAWIVDREGRLDHPRRSTTPSCAGITRTTLIDLLRREKLELVERPFTRGGSQGRARGLHHLGDQHRHAGGAHRRQADRQRRARAALARSCGPNFIRRRKSPTAELISPSGNLPLQSARICLCSSG